MNYEFINRLIKNLKSQSDIPDYTTHLVLAGLASALERTIEQLQKEAAEKPVKRGLPL